VRPYLACHSVELVLKAFLSLHGAEMFQLAEGKYGHNLEAILEEAIQQGLKDAVGLSHAEEAVIRGAGPYYGAKVFEYPAVGEAMLSYPGMPSLDSLFDVTSKLVEALRKPCSEAR
jgi:hypothetical protein